MAHTHGPWMVESSAVQTLIVNDEGFHIAEPFGGLLDNEQEANARLIAAAPELLAALELLLAWGRDNLSPVHNPGCHPLLLAAHEAIAKAKGGA